MNIGSPLFMSQRSLSSPKRVSAEVHHEELHPGEQSEEIHHEKTPLGGSQTTIAIIVPPVQRRWEYQVYHEGNYVDEVVDEYDDSEGLQFLARLSDGSEVKVSFYWANRVWSYILESILT